MFHPWDTQHFLWQESVQQSAATQQQVRRLEVRIHRLSQDKDAAEARASALEAAIKEEQACSSEAKASVVSQHRSKSIQEPTPRHNLS